MVGVKRCPDCGSKVITYSNLKLDCFISYCTKCEWIDPRQMYEGLIIEPDKAVEIGMAMICPHTGNICPFWEIEELGMSIEEWHRRGKGSLTTK